MNWKTLCLTAGLAFSTVLVTYSNVPASKANPAPSVILSHAKQSPGTMSDCGTMRSPSAMSGDAMRSPSAMSGEAMHSPSAMSGEAMRSPSAMSGEAMRSPSAMSGDAMSNCNVPPRSSSPGSSTSR